MSLTKVAKATLYAIAQTNANAVSVGAAVDVSTYYAVFGRIRVGRTTGTAFSAGAAPSIRLEVTTVTGTPNADDWTVLNEFVPALGSSVASQAVSGTEAAGQTVITLAAGTNFAARDFVFFHNTTIGSSEWGRVASVSGADITLEEAIDEAQTGSTVRDQAEQYPIGLDLIAGIQKMRLVVVGGDQAVIVQADFGAVTSL